MTAYKFGTVFRFKDNDYIWLALDKNQVYAAIILNPLQSKTLNNSYNNKIRCNPSASILEGLMYSFVILETKELKDRAAYFYDTGKERFDTSLFTTLDITLTLKDLKELKEEITKKRCIIIRLKELINGLKI